MRYKIICHKDLNDPRVVYNLLMNYEKVSGKPYIEDVKLRKFNYTNLKEFLLAYGLSTQWFVSKFEKFKTSPFAKVRWLDFVPHIMQQKECDREKAINIINYVLATMSISNNDLRKELFFTLYEKGEEYLSFEYDLVPEEVANFVFFVEKITEDGVRPKFHPEKIPFDTSLDETYFKKVPSDAYVLTKEDKEEIEELIQTRITIADSDEEVAFLFGLSERLGIGVLK